MSVACRLHKIKSTYHLPSLGREHRIKKWEVRGKGGRGGRRRLGEVMDMEGREMEWELFLQLRPKRGSVQESLGFDFGIIIIYIYTPRH